MAKRSRVRIFSATTTTALESRIENILNAEGNKNVYIQSISISHDEYHYYAAVVFNTEVTEK